jgi:lipoprotein-anchoring transpeptidase ErfK/SrfK
LVALSASCSQSGGSRVVEVGVEQPTSSIDPLVDQAVRDATAATGSPAAAGSTSLSLSASDSLSASGSISVSLVNSSDAASQSSSQSSLVASISQSQSRWSSQLDAIPSTTRGAIVAAPPASTMTTLPVSVRPTAHAVSTSAKPAAVAKPSTSAAPRPTAGAVVLGAHQSLVATAAVAKVAVYASPGGRLVTTVRSPQASGFPLVFLAIQDTGDWLQVYLPLRPNGSSGWIAKRDVSLTYHDYRIVVELGAHKLTVYKAGAVVMNEPIGVGTSSAPTPGGVFYTKEILKVPNAGGPYGPYAYGLSGFSDVYESFGSGPGTIGIHGTNDPTSIGRDVSHGCIRLTNSAITKMANTLPIGVPVEIRP